jgi:Rad3-related DNA helicase
VQKARLASLEGYTRQAAFQRVYQIPGIQKVNQALGRLVRAPGQRAKVILHCRRFLEPAYAALLDRDYQFGATLSTNAELAAWLGY